MVLTINYYDLQNIRKQVVNEKITDEKRIYMLIDSYKSTLNYMYKNNLVKDKSRTDFEYELYNFAIDMLKNTSKSYKELECKFMPKTVTSSVIEPEELRLII